MQSFHQWCIKTHSDETIKNTIVGDWIDCVLQDQALPWHETCQDIYEYLKDDVNSVEAFLCAWEMSGRVVEIDVDYSSETFDEYDYSSDVSE